MVKNLDERVEKFNSRYKCECLTVDSHGCHDCQNTGYLYDTEECSLILDLYDEVEIFREANKQLADKIKMLDLDNQNMKFKLVHALAAYRRLKDPYE